MTQEVSPGFVGLGLCARDSNVWVYQGDRRKCLLCGRDPDYIIPVNGAEGVAPPVDAGPGETASPPPAPSLFRVNCLHCGGEITLEISPDSVAVVQPPVDPNAYAFEPVRADVEPDAEREEDRLDETARQAVQ